MPIARPAPLLAALLLGACATTPGGDAVAQRDPWEGYNRFMYGVNRSVDRAVIRPAAQGYRFVTPEAGRRGVANAFNNVDEPLTFVNAVLQAKPKSALRALARFVINTVLGVGGLADHATTMGIPRQEEDFGQTFAVWGIGSGPYVVLPFLGPSTLRDGVGLGVEFAGGDPFRFALGELDLSDPVQYSLTGIELLSARESLLDAGDALTRGAADEYATVRSAYLQSRRAAIYDGAPPDDFDNAGVDAEGEGAAGAATPAPVGSQAAPADAAPPPPAPAPADPDAPAPPR